MTFSMNVGDLVEIWGDQFKLAANESAKSLDEMADTGIITPQKFHWVRDRFYITAFTVESGRITHITGRSKYTGRTQDLSRYLVDMHVVATDELSTPAQLKSQSPG